MVNEINVAKHYDKSDLYEVIKKGLLESGLILDSLSSQDLSIILIWFALVLLNDIIIQAFNIDDFGADIIWR